MKSDLDDIVFEKRNKDYGSYILRKYYHRGVIISVSSAILLGFLVVIIPYFIYLEELKNGDVLRQSDLIDYYTNLGNPEDFPMPPESQANQDAVLPDISNLPEIKNEAPIVVDSVIAEDHLLESSMDSVIMDQIQEASSGPGSNLINEKSNVRQPENHIYDHVDKMPAFKGGGIEDFREWVKKKTKYPKEASIRGIQGKVLITFVIEKDGSVSNVEVVRSVDPLIDNEAIKSVKSSPRWTPGMVKSETVRVSYFISVNFEL